MYFLRETRSPQQKEYFQILILEIPHLGTNHAKHLQYGISKAGKILVYFTHFLPSRPVRKLVDNKLDRSTTTPFPPLLLPKPPPPLNVTPSPAFTDSPAAAAAAEVELWPYSVARVLSVRQYSARSAPTYTLIDTAQFSVAH